MENTELRDYLTRSLPLYFDKVFAGAQPDELVKKCRSLISTTDLRKNRIDIASFKKYYDDDIKRCDSELDRLCNLDDDEVHAYYYPKLQIEIVASQTKNQQVQEELNKVMTAFQQFANCEVYEENKPYLAFQTFLKDKMIKDANEIRSQATTTKNDSRLKDFINRDKSTYHDTIFYRKRQFHKFSQCAQEWNAVIETAINEYYPDANTDEKITYKIELVQRDLEDDHDYPHCH